MKRNSLFLIIALFITLFSCNLDEKVNSNGFIRIGVVTNTSVITKAEEDVEIKNIRLVISNITEDSSDKDWSKEYNFAPNESIEDVELAPGNYKLVAIASNGSETANGFNPVYRGETIAEVIAGETKSAQIECKLTTVKVSVEYDQNLKDTYQTEYKTVVGGVTFSSNEEGHAGYITPGDLSVDFMFKNNAGSWQTISLEKIAEAKACEYYKIKISMKPTEGEEGSTEGAANITIKVGEENPENIEIGIVLPKTTINTLSADNVLTNSAMLKGEYVSPSGKVTPSDPKFFYKKKGTGDWTNVSSTGVNGQYSASLTGLDEFTEYEYKFMEKGNIVDFKTKEGDKTLEEKAVGTDIAYIYGKLNTNATDIYFEYKLSSSGSWTKASATNVGDDKYKAELTGLTAGQSYQYRFIESKTIQTLTTCSSITLQSVTAGADYTKIKWDIQSSSTLQDSDQIIVSYKYKKQGEAWGDTQTLTMTVQENGNKIILTGLEQNGTYCVDDDEKLFTTLKNADFNDWGIGIGLKLKGLTAVQDDPSKKVPYADLQDQITTGNSYWDSGNKGTSVNGAYPTNSENNFVRSGNAVKLESQFVGLGSIGKFAAGNIYTGKFGTTYVGLQASKLGAHIQFGKSFSARPTGLKGWYHYTSATVNYSTVQELPTGQSDKCSIYMILSNAPFEVDTRDKKYINPTDPSVIAYGELPDKYTGSTNGDEYIPFEFDVDYKGNTNIPQYIVICASASKYGDYFTGGEGSLMYIDDFELVYDYSKPPYK